MRGSIVHTHDVVNRIPPGLLSTEQDRIRYTAHGEGMRAMRDQIATDLTYIAESAPNQEAADWLWDYIMALKGKIIP
jgi:hypothetical protein